MRPETIIAALVGAAGTALALLVLPDPAPVPPTMMLDCTGMQGVKIEVGSVQIAHIPSDGKKGYTNLGYSPVDRLGMRANMIVDELDGAICSITPTVPK